MGTLPDDDPQQATPLPSQRGEPGKRFPSQISLTDPLEVLHQRGYVVSGSFRSPQVQQAELNREAEKYRHELWKDRVAFVVVVVSTATVLLACLVLVFASPQDLPSADAGTKEWARSIIVAVIGGFVGYMTGKKT